MQMFFRTAARLTHEFHVLVLSDGDVIADELLECSDKRVAFQRAEALATMAGKDGQREVLAYVLDGDQTFLGSVEGSSQHWQAAA